MKLFGLLGYPLSHSFSKKYFTEKFEREGIQEHQYELFELPEISLFKELIAQNPPLCGLNVTIPHKQAIIPYLDFLDESAEKVGAVNVIKFMDDGKLVGYNSDYFGFKQSLENWLDQHQVLPIGKDLGGVLALVLGNGGAAKAVMAVLTDLGIKYQIVSRQKTENSLIYEELTEEIIQANRLIINASPVGTYPKDNVCPAIPYQFLTPEHFLYDLVYNPVETWFLKKGKEQGAKTHNGLAMLHLQAEKAWEIWNS